MDDEEVAFRMEAWSESVATGGRPVVASHWSSEQSPQHETVCAEEIVDEQVVQEEVIAMEEMIQSTHPDQQYIVGGEILPHSISQSLDQMAAENLIYMAQDGSIGSMMTSIIESQENVDNHVERQGDPQYFECQVTEEVITDDWVQTTGQDRVEIVVDQLGGSEPVDDEIDIALPTDQDEYTASRPHPCDFCSRRFRKKANLMNHMVAHQNDRPHGCNLCGARYANKQELMNHLKIHAYAPAEDEPDDDRDMIPSDINEIAEEFLVPEKQSRKRSKNVRSRKNKIDNVTIDHSSSMRQSNAPATVYEDMDEDMRILTEAAEQHYAHAMSLEPRYPVIDPRKPFVCQHCGVGFAREKALASHARIHGGDSPFECETCGEMFWDSAVLREHTRTKHQIPSSNSEYEPENDESDISDTDSKFGDYYCNTCGMSFHRVDLLRRHARLHIKKEITDSDIGHVCNVCGETFREALDLLAHAEVHARYQPHRCMLCGECFSDETSVTTHVQSIHAESLTSTSCNLCGKHCRDRRALLKHAWDHSKQRHHTCSKCSKTFNNKARLKRHMASHRNKSVSCDICGDKFPDGRSLMNHRHSHSSISGRQFPCRECGKTFGSRSSQQIHIRIHTGERPYGCRFCWKAFADGGTLRKHERIHTGEKPYACAVCPRAFNQRVVLREHIRSHHSGPDTSRSDARNPYSCAVCDDTFSVSHDLVQHLIGHSDMNTAMKRQPQVGPRKYKRRRKLKPYEVDRLVRRSEIRKEKRRESEGERESDVWYSDNSPVLDEDLEPAIPVPPPQNTVSNSPSNKKATGKKQKASKPANDDGYQAVCNSFETVMQSFSSLVKDMKANKTKKKKEIAPAQPSRPKMIHTAKTRVDHTVEGKKKTKTLITRTTAPQASFSGERNRPRTKNVSYHVLQADKLPPAVFPDAQMQSDLENILALHTTPMRIKSEPKDKRNDMECVPSVSNEVDIGTTFDSPLKDMKGIEKFNSDLVHDLEQILQSPIRPKLNTESSNGLLYGKETSEKEVETRGITVNTTNHVKDKPVDTSRNKKTENRIETRNRGVPKRSFKPLKQARKINLNHTVTITSNDFKDVIVKEEIMEQEPDDNESDIFRCEMCSETFSTRSALLVHIPVHI